MKKNVLRFSAAAMALIMTMGTSVFADGTLTNASGNRTQEIEGVGTLQETNFSVTVPTSLSFTIDQFNANADNNGDALTSGDLRIDNDGDLAAKVDVTAYVTSLNQTDGKKVTLKKVSDDNTTYGVSKTNPGITSKDAYLKLVPAVDIDPTSGTAPNLDNGKVTYVDGAAETIYTKATVADDMKKDTTKMSLILAKPKVRIYKADDYKKIGADPAVYITEAEYDNLDQDNKNLYETIGSVVKDYAFESDAHKTFAAFKIAGVANPYANWEDNDIKVGLVFDVSAVPAEQEFNFASANNKSSKKVAKTSFNAIKLEDGKVSVNLFANSADADKRKNKTLEAATMADVISDVKVDYETVAANTITKSADGTGKLSFASSTIAQAIADGRSSVPVTLKYDGVVYSGDLQLGTAITNITSTTTKLTIPTTGITGFKASKLTAMSYKVSTANAAVTVAVNDVDKYEIDKDAIVITYPAAVPEDATVDVTLTYDKADYKGTSSAVTLTTKAMYDADVTTDGVTIKLFEKAAELDATKAAAATVKVNAATIAYSATEADNKFTVNDDGTITIPMELLEGTTAELSVLYDGVKYTKDITVTEELASIAGAADKITVKIFNDTDKDKAVKTNWLSKQPSAVKINGTAVSESLTVADDGTITVPATLESGKSYKLTFTYDSVGYSGTVALGGSSSTGGNSSSSSGGNSSSSSGSSDSGSSITTVAMNKLSSSGGIIYATLTGSQLDDSKLTGVSVGGTSVSSDDYELNTARTKVNISNATATSGTIVIVTYDGINYKGTL